MLERIVSIVFSMSTLAVYGQVPTQGTQVQLQLTWEDPSGINNKPPKAPVQPPYVTLDDHTLYIWSQHNGFTLTLIDDNDTVVYQTYIPAGLQYAVLPATLSGTFVLQLSDDTYMYTGTIGLE